MLSREEALGIKGAKERLQTAVGQAEVEARLPAHDLPIWDEWYQRDLEQIDVSSTCLARTDCQASDTSAPFLLIPGRSSPIGPTIPTMAEITANVEVTCNISREELAARKVMLPVNAILERSTKVLGLNSSLRRQAYSHAVLDTLHPAAQIAPRREAVWSSWDALRNGELLCLAYTEYRTPFDQRLSA